MQLIYTYLKLLINDHVDGMEIDLVPGDGSGHEASRDPGMSTIYLWMDIGWTFFTWAQDRHDYPWFVVYNSSEIAILQCMFLHLIT